jgi:hypothetical protein
MYQSLRVSDELASSSIQTYPADKFEIAEYTI